jgi:hypothetical protein
VLGAVTKVPLGPPSGCAPSEREQPHEAAAASDTAIAHDLAPAAPRI